MFLSTLSKKSLVSAVLLSSLVLSCPEFSEAKMFKIKAKPAEETSAETVKQQSDAVIDTEIMAKEASKKQAKPKKAVKKETVKKEIRKPSAAQAKEIQPASSSVSAFDEYGIAVEEKTFAKSSGDVPVHVIRVDLNQGKVVPKIVLAEENKLGSKANVVQICKNYDAVAGVNGSFFDAKTYAAVGYLMIDGRAIQAPLIVKARTTFGITRDNKVMIGKPKFRRRIRPENDFFSMIDGINKKCGFGEIVIYTADYAKKVTVPKGGMGYVFDAAGVVTELIKNESRIPAEGGLLVVSEEHLHRFKNTAVGTKILFTQSLMTPWDQVRDAFGSGMLLVTDGKITFDQSREEVGRYLMGDAPRTAIGITAANELVMAVADGRSSSYRGVDFDEIAQIMIDCGCTDAIALDGGGSSTLVYKGDVLNTPSDKNLRKVANALVLLKTENK
ncbi:MAG: hypothetical protein BWY32_00327 [bacterium ADurb.Bin243]|nr:MAG: hypothetical protein BWY32_00327 [bacterium ADurb.Bin243]